MLCLHQITEAFHDWSQKRSSFTGWVMVAIGCMVQRSIAQARIAGSRSLNRRFSKSCRDGPLVSSVLTAVGRLTMSGSASPFISASASAKTTRATRSRASSAARAITMPPVLVPASTTSFRSS